MKQPTTEGAGTGWAVVTGASSGLGREFALAIAARGHPVLAVACRGERLRALADEVGARGSRLAPLVADLRRPRASRRCSRERHRSSSNCSSTTRASPPTVRSPRAA
jgi:short-subunit dehydrogenase